MKDDHIYSISARFRIADVRIAYEQLTALADQISPEAAAVLCRLNDRLTAVGLPYVEGFSVKFANGAQFTRGWQSATVDSRWKEKEQ